MEFNKELFACLLQKARGDRSINGFGSEANVDPGYISRLLRCQVEKPPGAMILMKIAGKASNDITIEQLLGAAGYVDLPYHEKLASPDNSQPATDAIPLTDQNKIPVAARSPVSGPGPDVYNFPEIAAADDFMVEELLSYCSAMIERPALLDAFKQIKDLSNSKLRRALKLIKMIANMGD